MILVFGIVLIGLEAFVTYCLFTLGSGYLDLDYVLAMMELLSLVIVAAYLVVPIWGAWVANRLISKNRKIRRQTGSITKMIFWLILIGSLIGALIK